MKGEPRRPIPAILIERLRILKYRDGLSDLIISQRLGRSPRELRKICQRLHEQGLDHAPETCHV